MKFNIVFTVIVIILLTSCTNEPSKKNLTSINNETLVDSLYDEAMSLYDKKSYALSSKKFDSFFKEKGEKYYRNGLYNAACVYALNNETEKAINWLNYLANEKFYSNIDHIKSDTDLINLHNDKRWEGLLTKIENNKKTEPIRKREKIKTALFNAKDILINDNGNTWGKKLWSEDILIIDYDKTIYSLDKLPNSNTKDSILFFKKFNDNELVFVNSTQKYNNKNYATLVINSISDNSATIIHELYHLSHFKVRDDLNANPIKYLDKYEARVLLRLEYQSLKNALNLIDQNEKKSTIQKYINDAFVFRKTRQDKNKSFLKDEVDIETVEGLANYTGILLSTYTNKYLKAIAEINEREEAKTYTRPFPYATGPAYGLLFDYLNINWKKGLQYRYNFLKIYEQKFLNSSLYVSEAILQEAKKRNNHTQINTEELKRKTKQDDLISYYTTMFVEKATLSVELLNNQFGLLFNMNGTIYLEDIGMVYSGAKGTSMDKTNFGNFEIISGKDRLGIAGVLKISDEKTIYKFPLPIKIEGNIIFGEFYKIVLNPGWKIEKNKTNDSMRIVKK